MQSYRLLLVAGQVGVPVPVAETAYLNQSSSPVQPCKIFFYLLSLLSLFHQFKCQTEKPLCWA